MTDLQEGRTYRKDGLTGNDGLAGMTNKQEKLTGSV